MKNNNNGTDNYHGPDYCPKCGYDGMRAVVLGMLFNARQKGLTIDSLMREIEGGGVHVHAHPHPIPLPAAEGQAPLNGPVRRGTKIPPEMEARIMEMKANGKTGPEISAATGRSRQTIYSVIYRMQKEKPTRRPSLPPPPWPKKPSHSNTTRMTEADRDKVRSLKGKTVAEITAITGWGKTAVHRVLSSPVKPHAGKLPPRPQNLYCPECKAQGVTVGPYTAQGLSSHRRKAHNVIGTSETAIRQRAESNQPEAAAAS